MADLYDLDPLFADRQFPEGLEFMKGCHVRVSETLVDRAKAYGERPDREASPEVECFAELVRLVMGTFDQMRALGRLDADNTTLLAGWIRWAGDVAAAWSVGEKTLTIRSFMEWFHTAAQTPTLTVRETLKLARDLECNPDKERFLAAFADDPVMQDFERRSMERDVREGLRRSLGKTREELEREWVRGIARYMVVRARGGTPLAAREAVGPVSEKERSMFPDAIGEDQKRRMIEEGFLLFGNDEEPQA